MQSVYTAEKGVEARRYLGGEWQPHATGVHAALAQTYVQAPGSSGAQKSQPLLRGQRQLERVTDHTGKTTKHKKQKTTTQRKDTRVISHGQQFYW